MLLWPHKPEKQDPKILMFSSNLTVSVNKAQEYAQEYKNIQHDKGKNHNVFYSIRKLPDMQKCDSDKKKK